VNVGRTAIFPNVTERQMIKGGASCLKGELVQNAFPFLSVDQREFLLTGLFPEEWDKIFGEED
jgi:hypothetical protein